MLSSIIRSNQPLFQHRVTFGVAWVSGLVMGAGPRQGGVACVFLETHGANRAGWRACRIDPRAEGRPAANRCPQTSPPEADRKASSGSQSRRGRQRSRRHARVVPAHRAAGLPTHRRGQGAPDRHAGARSTPGIAEQSRTRSVRVVRLDADARRDAPVTKVARFTTIAERNPETTVATKDPVGLSIPQRNSQARHSAPMTSPRNRRVPRKRTS